MRAALVVALGLVACQRPTPSGAEEPVALVADQNGVPRLTVLAVERGAFRFQAAGVDGRLLPSETAVYLVEGDGHTHRVAERSGALVFERFDGPALELRRVDDGLRLGDEQRIPHARVRVQGAEALLFDAGGRPLRKARLEGGRIVLEDRDGTVVGYARGTASLERAVLAASEALTPAERTAVLVAPRWP